MRPLTCSLLLLITMGCKLQPGSAIDAANEEVHDIISSAWREHIAAAVDEDLAGVIAMYASDMLYVVPGQREVRGLRDLEAMERETLAELDVVSATHTIHDLRVFGDAAYEISTVEGPVRAPGAEAEVFAFHFMGMWTRQADGAWRLRYLVGQP